MYFFDANSDTFVNVEESDKSVFIAGGAGLGAGNGTEQSGKHELELVLGDTNRYAPGPHPFTYGGESGRQFVTSDAGGNILCYKGLNGYQLRSPQWISAETFRLRHHKGCNFGLDYVEIESQYIKAKHPWRDGEEDEDNAERLAEMDKEEEREEAFFPADEKTGIKRALAVVDANPADGGAGKELAPVTALSAGLPVAGAPTKAPEEVKVEEEVKVK